MQDVLGLEYTTNDASTPALFNLALEKYLASDATTMPQVEEVLSVDPNMPMALVFRAYLLKLAADPRFKTPIAKCADALKQTQLNHREQLHLSVTEQLVANRLDKAADTLDGIISHYPKDVLAIRVAHYLHFYGLGSGAMLRSLNTTLSQWQPGDPYYGYMKGMECFALEESGEYERAEAAGREALDINPADIWAAHAVTHVLQMQQRFDEGVPFIESLKGNWDGVNNFANHLHWHQALQYIGLGETNEALRIYDDLLIKPIKDDFYLDTCNAASLLWRFVMLGIDVGSRWQQLHEISSQRVEDDELVFSTLHYLMAPAVLGDDDAMQRCLNNIEAWSERTGSQSEVCRQVGKTLAAAICRLGNGESSAAVKLITSVKAQIHQIGGSHAQRHLFDQMIKWGSEVGTGAGHSSAPVPTSGP